MNYECHITCHLHDAAFAGAVATALHWKTSEIARDPVLGSDTYFYLTSHGATYGDLFTRMEEAEAALVRQGVEVVRKKIEHIVYDTKTGMRPEHKDFRSHAVPTDTMRIEYMFQHYWHAGAENVEFGSADAWRTWVDNHMAAQGANND